jgi:hypothetical protein
VTTVGTQAARQQTATCTGAPSSTSSSGAPEIATTAKCAIPALIGRDTVAMDNLGVCPAFRELGAADLAVRHGALRAFTEAGQIAQIQHTGIGGNLGVADTSSDLFTRRPSIDPSGQCHTPDEMTAQGSMAAVTERVLKRQKRQERRTEHEVGRRLDARRHCESQRACVASASMPDVAVSGGFRPSVPSGATKFNVDRPAVPRPLRHRVSAANRLPTARDLTANIATTRVARGHTDQQHAGVLMLGQNVMLALWEFDHPKVSADVLSITLTTAGATRSSTRSEVVRHLLSTGKLRSLPATADHRATYAIAARPTSETSDEASSASTVNRRTSQQSTPTSVTIDTAESTETREHGIICLVAAGNSLGIHATSIRSPLSLALEAITLKLTTLHDRGALRTIGAGTLTVAMHDVGAKKAKVQQQLVNLLIENIVIKVLSEEQGREIMYSVLPESPHTRDRSA